MGADLTGASTSESTESGRGIGRSGVGVPVPGQRTAGERGSGPVARQVHDRRREVAEGPRRIDPTALRHGRSRGDDQQRDVDLLVVKAAGVAVELVLAEVLAVVGRDDRR